MERGPRKHHPDSNVNPYHGNTLSVSELMYILREIVVQDVDQIWRLIKADAIVRGSRSHEGSVWQASTTLDVSVTFLTTPALVINARV